MKSSFLSLALICGALVLLPSRTTAAGSDMDERPVPVKSIAPEYPADMKREGQSGLVYIKVVIDENGDVIQQSVEKSTRAEFEAPALAAVSHWKFKPAKKNGAAVRVGITIPIKFSAES
jgi:protein TonB